MKSCRVGAAHLLKSFPSKQIGRWAVPTLRRPRRPHRRNPPMSGPFSYRSRVSLAEDLDQDSLRPAAVELAVEDLLPGAEVELAVGDGDDDLAAHDLPLHVGVGVVLAGAVVG